MGDLIVFIGGPIVFFLCLGLAAWASPFRSRRYDNNWTEFDKDGRPVRGVGYRGYWTNYATFGETPFRHREDGTWYNPETGEDCESVTLEELTKLHDFNE
jgi:hypothetical protein